MHEIKCRITHAVSTGEADGGGRSRASAANDVDLSAFHLREKIVSIWTVPWTIATTYVELSTRVRTGTVEGDHLRAQKVLTRLNTLGNADGVDALAVDDLLGTPDTVGEAVLLDLEPAATDTRVSGRVVDLLEVCQSWALVGDIHDIIR